VRPGAIAALPGIGGWLQALIAARGQLLPWAPVLLSLGIGGYFALPVEPPLWFLAAAAAVAVASGWAALGAAEEWRLPAAGLALVAGGFVLAAARAHLVAAPVLPLRYYGPVEGRVVDIDRSFSDQIRLTLDRVVLADTAPARTPARVRIALHGDQAGFMPEPGMVVLMTAHLSPPDGPVAPGGFDFQRLAWFSGLGAVGYTRAPVMLQAVAEGGPALLAFRMRMALSAAMQARMDGQAGAFAAALMTGDRSGVTAATNEALRASNLSHMISISGLHMGLLTGFVFALVRYGLALVPPLALRLNGKKLAAMIALLAASFYMVLAGSDVATRRSYIMAAVMLVAVLADRRAVSLRSLAIAALICLVLEPESLIEPGFQMSFGATAALIVGFEHWTRVQGRVPGPLRPVAVMILSSLIAGAATAPVAAAHFNRIAEYGLIANLLAVPVMGIIVMPAGVVAALFAPLGLAGPALWVMGRGTALILFIAEEVAAMDGAVIPVAAPPWPVLPVLGLAGAGLLIARGWPVRALAAAGLALAFGLWAATERPALLIAGDGTLAGLMTDEGRALSKPRGGGFVAQSWLEDDGDLAGQADAFGRAAFAGPRGARTAALGPVPVRLFAGKGAAGRAAGACADRAIVVLSEDWAGPAGGDCLLFDRAKLRATGALAIYLTDGAPRIVSAREAAGSRLWNARPARRGDDRTAKAGQ
jgi:competence protein ComEC